MPETVASKAKNFGISNIIANRVNVEKEKGSELENECVDWVIMKDILFQNKGRNIVVAEAYRILKSGGKVIAAEWNQENFSIGPEQKIRIPVGELKKIFIDQKFSIAKDIEAGDFHYAFVAVK